MSQKEIENLELLLRKAIKDGNIDLMNQHLSELASIDINMMSWQSRTPLLLMEIVDYPESDTLNNEKQKEIFNALLKASGNISQQKVFINQDSLFEHKTALHEAVENNKPTLAKLLLENGANPNLQDFHKRTALHAAVATNNLESYKDLLLAGADPTIEDKNYFVADDFIREDKMSKFDEIKQEVNTVKGVAVFNHMYPNPSSVYESFHAEDKQNLHDYSGGIKRRKTIRRRKTIKRRKTIRRRKIIKRRK
jgi:ankyrin repeat protein